jgi:two-component system sensor histidine kinase PilS (NtrC family)
MRGEAMGVTAIFQDISSIKRVEALSRQTVRLKTLAEMSASMAQEIRGPLDRMRGSLERLEGPALPGERSRILGVLKIETGRLAGLLEDFLRFSRIRVSEWKKIDLLKLLGEIKALMLVRSDIASRITFHFQGFQGGGRDEVWGDPELLKQAFLNLFINAAESIPGNGNIRIGFRSRDGGVPGISRGQTGYRMVFVEDDGPGFSEEVMKRAFDPFFTTKMGASGLGLTIVQRITEAHRGKIELNSRKGEGARFSLVLPAERPVMEGRRDSVALGPEQGMN